MLAKKKESEEFEIHRWTAIPEGVETKEERKEKIFGGDK